MGKEDTGQITTLNREMIKSYYVWTGDNITEAYQASASAAHGDACVKTSYSYDGDKVLKMKEELTTWDSSWDI